MAELKKLVVGDVIYDITDERKLPLPPQAQEGQMILVAAVDDTGRVTATRAADPAESFPDGDEVMY